MANRLLIAIPTAATYSGNVASPNRDEAARRTACRETWLADCHIDYRFFYGYPGPVILQSDEVELAVPEGYARLSTKFQSICKWALAHDYDFLLRIDTDAYLYPDRLLRSGYEQWDYAGYTIDYPLHLEHARYASGAGWTLSRRSMTILANEIVTNEADDFWTGKTLYAHGIKCHRDTRFCVGFEPHFIPLSFLPPTHPAIILHALRPEGIRDVHNRPYPGDDITPTERGLFEPTFNFAYGPKKRDCGCPHCQS